MAAADKIDFVKYSLLKAYLEKKNQNRGCLNVHIIRIWTSHALQIIHVDIEYQPVFFPQQ